MDGRSILGSPWSRFAAVLAAAASLAACATIEPRYPSQGAARPLPAGGGAYKVGKPYQVAGVWYVPREQPDYDEAGIGSWYGDAFHGKPTANGEIFDMRGVSAAHTTLPLPSIVEVTNLENGRKLKVRVNDRGPFVGGRIIDLSHEAARRLGYERQGVARVRVRYVGRAPLGPDTTDRYAAADPAPPAPPPIETAAPAPAPVSGLRIQAAAFASEANAHRAASQLAAAGPAVVEPLQRDGFVLYRVLVEAPADEAAAFALRDRVADLGFADARVVRAF